MADYGHEPALTQLCERLGLDLAIFQDHPYQPAFLDTWTRSSAPAALGAPPGRR